MCGISGVFGRRDEETVKRMIAKLVHRGPDDGHTVAGDDFTLGARRLSIVGVEDGRQPLSNETGTVWAAQNGELYNYPQVRRELLAEGHELHTHCDTEILPHLYEDYGTRLPEHIDGMFAVAVWDDKDKVGLLARDRMGKKPLYYYRAGDALYFASEIKALLEVPGFERRINFEALNHFLSFKHVPAPLSIFEGVYMLPPAHMLVYRPGAGLEVRRYWDLDFSAAGEMAEWPESELVEHLLALLRRGVERRLMSDVPIGFFLSGGIDSTLSTALAAELSPGRIKTFTLTYADGSTTEGKEQDRRWARWAAERYQTEHYEEAVEFSNFPENLRRIIACFDEPFSGTVSTYFLAGLIAEHVKVAVSGDGADELFGSYLSHRLAFPLSRYDEYLQTGDANLIRPFQSQPEFLARMTEAEDWQWRSKLFVYNDEEKATLYAPEVAERMQAFSSRERLRRDFSGLTAKDPLNRILEAEFRTIFPDQVLAFVDRLSMAHSLEVRTAYMDTDFVKFITGLPGRFKIRDGETKYLLKKAALKYFPEEMVFRKKEGFLMPITEWLLNDLEDYVRETLSNERLSRHGLFNRARVRELVDGLYQTESDYTHVNRVFALLVFQEWFDMYMS
ncbi:MAG TPA: asparagine synthase (glutamine-hydrolyzing) [Pyrinomonadaceae bacterium]|jgi:asparagine synthase (glutamine-hydrolysing)|nr:asparagine synthase (glutamine-hydrolyzing) [Pyrinomonadaceae bacterium]